MSFRGASRGGDRGGRGGGFSRGGDRGEIYISAFSIDEKRFYRVWRCAGWLGIQWRRYKGGWGTERGWEGNGKELGRNANWESRCRKLRSAGIGCVVITANDRALVYSLNRIRPNNSNLGNTITDFHSPISRRTRRRLQYPRWRTRWIRWLQRRTAR